VQTLLSFSFALNAIFTKEALWLYHLTNIIFHSVSSVFIFLFTSGFGSPPSADQVSRFTFNAKTMERQAALASWVSADAVYEQNIAAGRDLLKKR